MLLLLLPLVPGLGVSINGSQIWIRAGGYSFQPGEIAKILLAISFASYLVLKREALALAGRRFIGIDLPRGRDLGPILLVWLVSLGVLVFEDDLGSSLLFFGLFVVLLYVATERPSWLIVGLLLFAAGAYLGYMSFYHVQLRVEGWMHPDSNRDAFYQIIQARYGLGWGGVLGQGWGQGSPQITPFSWSDFIATSLGEEIGLTGLMAIILLYAIVVERGIRTALVCRDAFGKLLSVGLAVALALQVFVVIGGVTKLIPLTGLTTPFMSYGGTSLLANWVIFAILMRISDQARRPPPQIEEPSPDDATQVVTMR
jgi:cell division protein FtsW (lipid II flippase)